MPVTLTSQFQTVFKGGPQAAGQITSHAVTYVQDTEIFPDLGISCQGRRAKTRDQDQKESSTAFS